MQTTRADAARRHGQGHASDGGSTQAVSMSRPSQIQVVEPTFQPDASRLLLFPIDYLTTQTDGVLRNAFASMLMLIFLSLGRLWGS